MSFPTRVDQQVIDSTWFNPLQDSTEAIHDTVFYAAQHSDIQAAIDAANTVGGGTVLIGPGTFDVQLTIYDNIHLVGAGIAATSLRLPDAANGAIIKSDGFDLLTGTNTQGGMYQWSVCDMTLDGNKANNLTAGYGLQVYGADFRLNRLVIEDCRTNGIYSEFCDAGSPTGSASAYVNQVKVKSSGVEGVNWLGPHDSNFNMLMTSNNVGSGAYFHTHAFGCQIVNSHSWANTQDYAYRLASSGLEIMGTQAEGAALAQILIEASNCSVIGGWLYSAGAISETAGIEIASGVSNTLLMTRIHNCLSGAIKWSGTSSGFHYHRCRIFQPSGSVVVGTLPANADTEYLVSGGAVQPRSVHPQIAQFPMVVTTPDTGMFVSDDFVSGSAATGNMGELGWSFSGGGQVPQEGVANHPGIVRKTTSATAGTYGVMRLAVDGLLIPSHDFEQLFIALPNSTDTDTTIRVGIGNASTDDPPANGVYFEKLGADTNWFAVTRDAGVQTRTDTGVAVTSTWMRFRVRRVDATTIGFSLNSGTEQTHTANIPTVALNPFIAISNNAASANKSIDIDQFSLLIQGLSR